MELFEESRWRLIHVQHGWDVVEGEIDPKSTAGVRTVPVCEQLYDVLSAHLKRLGRKSGLIFGRSPSQPFNYNMVRERSEPIWRKAKLAPSDLQLHEARHTCRSLMLAAGISKERRDWYLGHSDPSIGGRYEHPLEHQYLDDAQTFSDYLRRADTPTRLEQVASDRAPVAHQ